MKVHQKQQKSKSWPLHWTSQVADEGIATVFPLRTGMLAPSDNPWIVIMTVSGLNRQSADTNNYITGPNKLSGQRYGF